MTHDQPNECHGKLTCFSYCTFTKGHNSTHCSLHIGQEPGFMYQIQIFNIGTYTFCYCLDLPWQTISQR